MKHITILPSQRIHFMHFPLHALDNLESLNLQNIQTPKKKKKKKFKPTKVQNDSKITRKIKIKKGKEEMFELPPKKLFRFCRVQLNSTNYG